MKGNLEAGKGQSWCVKPLLFGFVVFQEVFHCADQASLKLKTILLPPLPGAPPPHQTGMTGLYHRTLLGGELQVFCVLALSCGQESPDCPCWETPSFPQLAVRDPCS